MDTVTQFLADLLNKQVSELDFPDIRNIDGAYTRSLFSNNSNLAYVNMPLLYNLTTYAFQNCTNLSSVNLNALGSVNQYMFANCTNLETCIIPNCGSIDAYAFSNCVKLSYIELPKVTTLAPNAFINCGIQSIQLPAFSDCTWHQQPSSAPFVQCQSLTYMEFLTISEFAKFNEYPNNASPKFNLYLPAYFTRSCYNLESVYLPNCSVMYKNFSMDIGHDYKLSFGGICAPNLELMCMEFYKVSTMIDIVHPNLKELSCGIGLCPVSIISLPELQYLSLYLGTNTPELTYISIPECSTFYMNGSDAINLTELYMPNVQYLSGRPFSRYSKLSSVTMDFNKIVNIGNYMFLYTPFASSQSEINLPNAVIVGANIFGSHITRLNVPKATTIGNYSGLANLNYINCESCTSGATLMFAYTPKVSYLNVANMSQLPQSFHANANGYTPTEPLPELVVIADKTRVVGFQAFYYNVNLCSISLPVCSYISGGAFMGCSSLMSVYLGSSSVVNLAQNATVLFTGTGIMEPHEGVYGSVFVPSSLVTAYKAHANWVGMSNRITAMPE